MEERGRVTVGFVVWAEGAENENSEGFEGGGTSRERRPWGEVVSAHCVDG